jgi:hypothetical protein
MRFHPSVVGLVIITTAIGCDPVFATNYRQTLHPAPALDCIAQALGTSPVVGTVRPLQKSETGKDGAGFQVTLRDTSARYITWNAVVTRRSVTDSAARVTVTYSYMGFPSMHERQQWATFAHQVLGAVRTTCAPNAPDAVECHASGSLGGQRGACRPAA